MKVLEAIYEMNITTMAVAHCEHTVEGCTVSGSNCGGREVSSIFAVTCVSRCGKWGVAGRRKAILHGYLKVFGGCRAPDRPTMSWEARSKSFRPIRSW